MHTEYTNCRLYDASKVHYLFSLLLHLEGLNLIVVSSHNYINLEINYCCYKETNKPNDERYYALDKNKSRKRQKREERA